VRLPIYDVVFASGRLAIEALACGCSVIVLGETGCGEMVRKENFERLRYGDFFAPIDAPCSAESIRTELERYSTQSCGAITPGVRPLRCVFASQRPERRREPDPVAGAPRLYCEKLGDSRYRHGQAHPQRTRHVHQVHRAHDLVVRARQALSSRPGEQEPWLRKTCPLHGGFGVRGAGPLARKMYVGWHHRRSPH
jgi:hypothetical protein